MIGHLTNYDGIMPPNYFCNTKSRNAKNKRDTKSGT